MILQKIANLLFLLPLINCQVLNYVLVTTGDPNDQSVQTELIDLNDANNICTGLPNYPLPLDGASGGRVDNVDEIWPVVCGGYYYGEYFDECIVIGKPELETRLLHARAYGAALSLPDGTLWITGGKGGEFGEELSSSERIEALDDVIVTEGPTLPVHIAYHCITMVNDKTIMMIGGYIDEDSGFSERTFSIDFDDLESGTWTDGPSMKNYRGYLGCGSFNSDFHGGVVTMAFGGWDGGRTIYDDSEILVEGADSWGEGPKLPQNLFQMATVTNPEKNGLLIVGGYSKGSGELSTLHQFTCPSSGCVWTVLEQQLQVPRAKHVAFLIDNSVFNCKQQGNSTELIF